MRHWRGKDFDFDFEYKSTSEGSAVARIQRNSYVLMQLEPRITLNYFILIERECNATAGN